MRKADHHTETVNRLINALPGVWWHQPVGVFLYPRGRGRISVNFDGIADVGGFMPGGRAGQIEVKTGAQVRTKNHGRTPAQIRWGKVCVQWGVFYAVLLAENESDIDGAVEEMVARVRNESAPGFPLANAG